MQHLEPMPPRLEAPSDHQIPAPYPKRWHATAVHNLAELLSTSEGDFCSRFYHPLTQQEWPLRNRGLQLVQTKNHPEK